MTPERLRDHFYYDYISGNLYWAVQKAKRNKVGSIAGWKSKQCVTVTIDYCNHKAHRVIWAIVYGVWPIKEIDHIDGDPHNNRIENLREVSHWQNTFNVRMHRDNVLGYKGVSRSKGKYLARIGGRRIGLFSSPQEAAEAYKQEAQKEYGKFNRLE